jgi:phosphoglycolate phosphatase
MMTMKRLVLFDIDGTLLTARGAPRRAFTRAMVEVYGTAGPIGEHRFDGKTDPQIARELLRAEGMADDAITTGLPSLWVAYLRELRQEFAAPSHQTHVYPGVRELLAALAAQHAGDAVLGLLTGNIAEGARLKLASAAIDTPFVVGAFGSDCERRDGLPTVAVERARQQVGVAFTRRDIVIIGDTPSDITCGLSLGVRAIGVATGSHQQGDLSDAGADAVFDDFSATADVLDAILS